MLQINLYRIVQEALNNIVKHAEATEANVRLLRTGQNMVLTIQDNGQGFTAASRSAQFGKSGFGLTGMAERAHLLDGEFSVQSAAGGGTLITVAISKGNRSRG